MERVLTVNHIPELAQYSSPRASSPCEEQGGKVSKASCPAHCTRQAVARLVSFGDNRSLMRRRASLHLLPSCSCPSCCHSCSNKRGQRHYWRFTTQSVIRFASPTNFVFLLARAFLSHHLSSSTAHLPDGSGVVDSRARKNPDGLRSLRDAPDGASLRSLRSDKISRAHLRFAWLTRRRTASRFPP